MSDKTDTWNALPVEILRNLREQMRTDLTWHRRQVELLEQDIAEVTKAIQDKSPLAKYL